MLRVTHFDLFNVQTWGILFPVLARIGSVFTFIYSMKLLFKTFRGSYQPEQLKNRLTKRRLACSYHLSFLSLWLSVSSFSRIYCRTA